MGSGSLDVFEAIEKRRSVRRYLSDPVPVELVDKLLDAARLAPSTSNVQSWRFKVVTDPATRAKLWKGERQRFVEKAPVVIACCVDLDAFKGKVKRTLGLIVRGEVMPTIEKVLRSVKRSSDIDPERLERQVVHGIINVSIASEHIVLAATELGLGTCWVRTFDSDAAVEALDLPDNVIVISLLTIGYPDESPAAKPRHKLEDIKL